MLRENLLTCFMHVTLQDKFRNTVGHLGHPLLVYYRVLLSYAGYMGEGVPERGKGIKSRSTKESIVRLHE